MFYRVLLRPPSEGVRYLTRRGKGVTVDPVKAALFSNQEEAERVMETATLWPARQLEVVVPQNIYLNVLSAGPLIICSVPAFEEVEEVWRTAVPWQVVVRQVVAMLKQHKVKRRDLYAIEDVAPLGSQRYREVERAYSGEDLVPSFWLYSWNGQQQVFTLVREGRKDSV